ncbi:MAG: DUF4982 domain-containing protein [Treponema sp.]|nr:DUF4982 domain-containing protein [Treponema sp.]
MISLFNDDWQFAEVPLAGDSMYEDGKPHFFLPVDFYKIAQEQNYKAVRVPHDWMISHVKDLYKNSVGCYKKSFTLEEKEVLGRHISVRFEGVYMNSAVWVNGQLAGEWKYGYSTFEFDISKFVKSGENQIQVIAVYQNCNTRWYSGAGIFRDVYLINKPEVFIPTDGLYVSFTPENPQELRGKWNCSVETEVAGNCCGHSVTVSIYDADCGLKYKSEKFVQPVEMQKEEGDYLRKNVCALGENQLFKAEESFVIENPQLWDVENPYCYKIKVELLDKDNTVIDEITQNCGFKYSVFDKNEGYLLNGKKIKLNGVCQHHDLGALGAAFDVNALRRQFNKLKDMGVNAVRCSHNPPTQAFMNLADEMGLLIDDEAFDMWEKPKTPFDYGNYFNDWSERDIASWVRKDRNHPCLLMWSIGNEIYDTHMGKGLEITKKLYSYVVKHDPKRVAPITIASNYMMSEGAQNCAAEIDVVGYNYLERLYNEHHEKYPEWKIYGSETSSTVQSRGIYHFPDSLKLVTFSDGQCSTLGNCTTTWGCANTQTVIANDRDCAFSAGQFIWTGWDYIGEPTPYHTKNSYFGQIDTAGFEKDTFYLYKSEWAYKKAEPFVHLLPYWDWNEGQIIDVKAYTNAEQVELFFNGKSLGKQILNHKDGLEPFGKWQLPYAKGEIKAVGYDENGREVASDSKRSFEDPAEIILKPETEDTGNLFFVDVMTADKNGTLVENARNYITINVTGDGELVGLDNGDSTDYDEYVSEGGVSHTRKLFSNRLVAIIRGKRGKNGRPSFVVTAASKDMPNCSIKYDGYKWSSVAPYNAIHAMEDFVPTRKIEIICEGGTLLDKNNPMVKVTAKVLPENASIKEIMWNPVLKECVSSDFISVNDRTGIGSGVETAFIKAVCDGECILRCTAKNGSKLDEVISDLNFTVEGIGNPKLNPYALIEGCRLSDWEAGKEKPFVSLESGVSTRKSSPCWISFDKVDFGNDGADTIHIPIFSFDTELPVEVWDGKPGVGTTRDGGAVASDEGTCLGKFIYKHESIYNTFSENVFILNKRLFGVHTISVVLPYTLEFHGFYFDKTLKALSKLRALDADDIVGDSFKKTDSAVEGIGNNVNLDFSHMDFGEEGAVSITICGKSNTDNNSINLKFFDEDGNSSTELIEFAHTDDYEEKTFEIAKVKGKKKMSFIFLPGCNFDFKWFKFNS